MTGKRYVTLKTFDERLRDVFADTFETSPDLITDDLSVDSSGEWDSMRSMVLASSLESEFDIEFSDDELVALDSFQKIKDALQAKGVT